MNHLIIIRARFRNKMLRDEYYKIARKYLYPSISVQSNKDFTVCLLTDPADIPVFEKEVGIKALYFEDRPGLDEYSRHSAAEIQTRHDIDDWMAPNYISEIQKAYWENRNKYKQFILQVSHPIKLIDKTGKECPMGPYTSERNSMFLSICRGPQGKFISILEKNHSEMHKLVDKVINLPPGLTKWVRHPNAITELRKYGCKLTDAAVLQIIK